METYKLILALAESGMDRGAIAAELKVKLDWLEKIMDSDSFLTFRALEESGGGAS